MEDDLQADVPSRSRARRSGIVLVAVVLLLAVGVGVFFIARAAVVDEKVSSNTAAVDRTCGVLAYQLTQSLQAFDTPGSPGYAYYLEHPDEKERAVAETEALLIHLGCEPIPPPDTTRAGDGNG